ncbi:MAG: hypothetical protein FGM14_16790 [Flavobacteriales bacterium]|nr:hypothetical protein [Flavobacteriales bacterium]
MNTKINFDLSRKLEFTLENETYYADFFYIVFSSIICRIYNSNNKKIGNVKSLGSEGFDLFGKSRKFEVLLNSNKVLLKKEQIGWSVQQNDLKINFFFIKGKNDIEVFLDEKQIGIIRYPISRAKLDRSVLEFYSEQKNNIIYMVILGFVGVSADRFKNSLSSDPFDFKDFWEK